MSDDKADNSTGGPRPAATTAAEPATPPQQLSGLMAEGRTASPASPRVDLEGEALRAAEQALADGERALAAARAQLQEERRPAPPQQRRQHRRRERLLRTLLAVNVLAMIVVSLLPAPTVPDTRSPAEPAHGTETTTGPVAGAEAPRFNEPWNRALQAAEARDFPRAVAVLEAYLADNPRMAPSQQLSVLMALSHYSARIGTSESLRQSQEYQRRVDAINGSHSLPEDLVNMAKAAADNGDQEALRRVWARFLLQQRQIPPWLYQHVARAYLQLGDSYRKDAADAADRVRREELATMAEQLRREAQQQPERPR